MKKAVTIILTVICGALANIIIAAATILLLFVNPVLSIFAGTALIFGYCALCGFVFPKIRGLINRAVFIILLQAPWLIYSAGCFAVSLRDYNKPMGNDMFAGLRALGYKLSLIFSIVFLAAAVLGTLGMIITPRVTAWASSERKMPHP